MSNVSQGLPIKTVGAFPAGYDMVQMGVNDSSPKFPVGTKLNDLFGCSYVYVQFGYTSAQGDAVCVDFSNAANTGGLLAVIAPSAATVSNFFGIAMNIVTSGNYGFVQVAGFNQVPLALATQSAGFFLKPVAGVTALANDHVQGNVIGAAGQSYMWGAIATTAVAGSQPLVGTVFIYGLGSVLAF